jgi:hypothetical protein
MVTGQRGSFRTASVVVLRKQRISAPYTSSGFVRIYVGIIWAGAEIKKISVKGPKKEIVKFPE